VSGAVKTDTANSKENTVKEEMGMTLLIRPVHSDTNDGRGKKILLLRKEYFPLLTGAF
jgi:hypothetical protein